MTVKKLVSKLVHVHVNVVNKKRVIEAFIDSVCM